MRKYKIMITSFIAILASISITASSSVDSSLLSTASSNGSSDAASSTDAAPPTPEVNKEVKEQLMKPYISIETDSTGSLSNDNNEEVTLETSNIYHQPFHPINQPPFADFSWTRIETVILFESKSYDPDGEIVRYWWWYDDYELNASFLMSTEPMFNYTFPEPGLYDVTLKVIDDDGASNVKTKTVIAYICYPPVADFNWTQIGNEIIFDGTISYDIDGQITKYFWMYYTIYGKPIPLGNTSIINYSFSDPGTYNVSLTVTDNDGGSDTVIKSIDFILASDLDTTKKNFEELDSDIREFEQIQIDSQLLSSNEQNLDNEIQICKIVFIPFSTQSNKTSGTIVFDNVFLKINFMFLDLPI